MAPRLALTVALVALCLSGCGGSKPQPPQPARDVPIRFESHGAQLSGTLHLPAGRPPFPTLVWVHASGPEKRDDVEPYFASLLPPGIAVFTYDKRGTGESGGRCCPLDFPLLADDVVAAVQAIRNRSDIDADHLGLYALSQGGWIVPIAATRTKDVTFAIVAAGTAVSLGEEELYSRLTGDDACRPTGIPMQEVNRRVAEEHPSLFDPRPYLDKLSIPVLWLYGALDKSQPVEKDVRVLEQLKTDGKDFTISVFPRANHVLLMTSTGNCWEGRGSVFVPGAAQTIRGWLRDRL
jgi:hypothetical protein